MKDIFDNIFSANSPDVNIIPVMNIDNMQSLKETEMPPVLPILTLRNAILFPETVIPVTIGRDKSIRLINESYKSNRLIGVVTQIDAKVEDPQPEDLFEVGTLGKIIKIIEMPDKTITAIVQGLRRFKVDQINITAPYLMAQVTYLADIVPDKNDHDMDAITDSIKDAALHIIRLSPNLPSEAGFAIKNLEGYEFLINFIASSIEIDNIVDKVELLRLASLKESSEIAGTAQPPD